MSKHILGHVIKDVSLILFFITGFLQKISSAFHTQLNPRIVPCGDIFKPQLLRFFKKPAEFHIPVAVYTRVRRGSGLISLDKTLYYLFTELLLKIKHPEIYAYPFANALCILYIIDRATGAIHGLPYRFILKKVHRSTHALISLIFKEQRRHT